MKYDTLWQESLHGLYLCISSTDYLEIQLRAFKHKSLDLAKVLDKSRS